jgi:hypothetical protein
MASHRVPQKHDSLSVFTRNPFSNEPSAGPRWWDVSFVGVYKNKEKNKNDDGEEGVEGIGSHKYVLRFDMHAVDPTQYRGYFRNKAIELKPDLFRDGSSDIPKKAGVWGFRDDIRFALKVQMAMGTKKCNFLQYEATGRLIRMPASNEQMLVLGRQHCNNDQHVSRCAASINFDEKDETWKLRFTGTNTGL